MSDRLIVEQVGVYQRNRHAYEGFAGKLKTLLTEIVQVQGLKIHTVEARAKTVESFREKILRPGKSYSDPMHQIDDLCGCRIITYYADDVDVVAELIRNEFEVVGEEMSHRTAAMETDRFGYLSTHLIIKLSQNRAALSEWKALSDLKAEVQIRSIIQHAWCAVSHALQYKQEITVPSSLQRRLHRIAGLFELADEEFVGIRDLITARKQSTHEAMKKGDEHIPLAPDILSEAVKSWYDCTDLNEYLRKLNFYVGKKEGYIEELYQLATAVGLESVNEVLKAISPPDKKFLEAAMGKVPWNASRHFVAFLLLFAKYHAKLGINYLIKLDWDKDIANRVWHAAAARRG